MEFKNKKCKLISYSIYTYPKARKPLNLLGG